MEQTTTFWSINFGHVITLFGMAVTALLFVYATRSRVDSLSERMLAVEGEIKALVEVLVEQARHEERLKTLDARALAEGQRLDALIARVNLLIDRDKLSDSRGISVLIERLNTLIDRDAHHTKN